MKGNYDLVDLVSLSVASTVGSGVFSLAGRVANQEAGPAVVVSLGIGALGCLLSATAYAELSSRVVAAGPGKNQLCWLLEHIYIAIMLSQKSLRVMFETQKGSIKASF